MDIVLVLLGLVAAVAAVMAAIGAWRPRPVDLAPVEARLKALDDTQRAATADLQKELNRVESALKLDLADRIQKTLSEFGDRQGESVEKLRKTIDETLRAARGEQGDQLEKIRGAFEKLAADTAERAKKETEQNATRSAELQRTIVESLGQMGERQGEQNATARRELTEALEKLNQSEKQNREAQTKAFEGLGTRISEALEKMRGDNEKKLEHIRQTVDEKLQSTLERRLGESFKQVSERLEQVHKGLGDMQQLATGVGDLKRVLTNVKSRGTFGEVQLKALIEDILPAHYYDVNVATVANSNDRVEVALKLPGQHSDGRHVWLPIDAKFPIEDYTRLQEAYERGDQAEVAAQQKALGHRLLLEAKTIRDKYVSPPETTNFAILFLPTEGLFAEALRLGDLVGEIRQQHGIVITGPTTLHAVLNSLWVGFQTLAISKQSGEISKTLAVVKTEFGKFGDVLGKVRKKLDSATKEIDITERRTRAMERALRGIDKAPEELVGETIPELAEEVPYEEE